MYETLASVSGVTLVIVRNHPKDIGTPETKQKAFYVLLQTLIYLLPYYPAPLSRSWRDWRSIHSNFHICN